MMKPLDDLGGPQFSESLTLGRDFRGMSQTDLATKAGVARQQIVNIEGGFTRQPTEQTIRALCWALELHPNFLTRSDHAARPTGDVLHFRGKARVSDRSRAQLLAKASVWSDSVEEIKAACTRLPKDSLGPVDGSDDLEGIAAKIRARWGIHEDAPIANVTRLLERSGAFVGTFDGGPTGVDAFCWLTEGTPKILCNLDRPTPSRWRFNLLHEASHLILHRGRATGDKATEMEANKLAGALLLPRRAFWQDFPQGPRLNWDGIFRMKKRWGAAVQAIIVRAHDLGAINASQYRSAFRAISAKGWRTKEPEEVDAERPELASRILSTLVRGGGTTPYDMALRLGIRVEDLSELSGSDASAFVSHVGMLIKLVRPTE